MPGMTFTCPNCNQALSADASFAGKQMRCPLCRSVVRVPGAASEPEMQFATVGTGASTAGGSLPPPPPRPRQITTSTGNFRPAALRSNHRFSFACVYCSSRLEATEAMSGTEGQCPTCGSAIVIPIRLGNGTLIDPLTKKVLKPDPHPVHAYAAAGERAPRILREVGGAQMIICRRCEAMNSITANNCKGCGTPFTMEGTSVDPAESASGFAVASLVLGIIGLPLACAVLPPVLAIIFGSVALFRGNGTRGGDRGMAIAGLTLGSIGVLLLIYIKFH